MKRCRMMMPAIVVLLICSCSGGDGGGGVSVESLVGYSFRGFNITFVFDESIYPNPGPVQTVSVAGQMNGWDPASPDWQAADNDGDGRWQVESSLTVVPCGTQFKFVVNGVDWQQPPAQAIQDQGLGHHLADDGFDGFNLVLVCE